MTSRAGAWRMSSVKGLKASPRMATRRPSRLPPSPSRSLPAKRRRCWVLTSMAALSSQKLWPWYPAEVSRARTSLGKQEPPQPRPALRKLRPMRGSRPIPSATFSISAPVSSQSWISLMKLILVARNAFEPYLISSALTLSQSSRVVSGPPRRAATRWTAASSSPRPPPARLAEVLEGSALAQELGEHHEGDVSATAGAARARTVPGGTVLLMATTAPEPRGRSPRRQLDGPGRGWPPRPEWAACPPRRSRCRPPPPPPPSSPPPGGRPRRRPRPGARPNPARGLGAASGPAALRSGSTSTTRTSRPASARPPPSPGQHSRRR